MNKEYLGDSVYIEQDDCGGALLTTENGGDSSNMIFLEPEVIQSFLRYMKLMLGHL